jgi:hypothetical protein
MAAASPLDPALLALDAAVGRLGGHHSRQVAEVRATAARVRVAGLALAAGAGGGLADPLRAVEAVLTAAVDAGVEWSDLVALVSTVGRRHAGPVRRVV